MLIATLPAARINTLIAMKDVGVCAKHCGVFAESKNCRGRETPTAR
jgi:hypothetical protein